MTETKNPLGLKKIHHVEFYVGNAKQAEFYYRKAFGFNRVAYSGLETGNRETTSYVIRQNRVNFVLTTPLTPEHPAAEHIKQHGDGVHDIAFLVEDADRRLQAEDVDPAGVARGVGGEISFGEDQNHIYFEMNGRLLITRKLTGNFPSSDANRTVTFLRKLGGGSFQSVGTSTLQSRACAGQVEETFVFCLPGSNGAVKDGWDKVIAAQLDSRHMPCNMVELMPRLMEA